MVKVSDQIIADTRVVAYYEFLAKKYLFEFLAVWQDEIQSIQAELQTIQACISLKIALFSKFE